MGRTGVSGGTGAVVVVDEVDAGGAVETLSVAVVDVDVAMAADPAGPAGARVVARRVDALQCVAARLRRALVHVCATTIVSKWLQKYPTRFPYVSQKCPKSVPKVSNTHSSLNSFSFFISFDFSLL